MNLLHMKVFVAVADTGSATAAAEQVHLSQPAVSRNIKALEESLGAKLFDRSGRGLQLNAAGRAMLPEARRILSSIEEAKRSARAAAERDFFDVRVGTVDSVATYLFPEAVPHLREAYPGLELKFYARRTSELLDGVNDGTFDVVLVAYSGDPPADHVAKIGRYDFQFYGAADHFPGLTDVTREEQLQQFPIVQLTPKPGQPTLIKEDTTSFALTNSLATIKALVLGGFGVGSLLHFVVEPEQRESLVRARVPHDPDCAVYAVRSDEWTGPTAEAIFETLVERLRELYPEPPSRVDVP